MSGQIDKATDGGAIDQSNTLTKRQKQILKLIQSDNKISRVRISEIIHIKESAIQKHLKTLNEKGHMKRVCGTRAY